jgi:hypothetical protein
MQDEELDPQHLKERFGALRDDELLRQALIETSELRPEARVVIAAVLEERFGPYRVLAAREVERAGKLFGRIRRARGFARLRAPGDPVLGGPDVPPHDGILFLATGGLGFTPTDASDEETFKDFDPAALQDPVAGWLGPEGVAWPDGVPEGSPRPLPLPLRARLDPAAGWIDREAMSRLTREKREWRLHVPEGADAVFRVAEASEEELLETWAKQMKLPRV